MLHIDDKATRRFGLLVHCAGGLLVIGGVVAAYLMIYAPTTEATARARIEIKQVQNALRQAPRIRRQHGRLNKQVQEMEDRLERIRRRVPQDAGESEFVSALTATAEEVGIVISTFKPALPEQKSGYWQINITVNGLANYESVCRFVDSVHAFSRLAKVVGLKISNTDSSGQGIYPVTLTVAIFYDLASEAGGDT